ncbi:hypothetical protein STCU_11287 [Strigomonas culicis]|uniref:Uncharacterized protein n=1 Tax=Strigomonas culicis TaxID=28005 RepID=S9V0S9_9TRYP|nr:hypothetical protein STCU_11287 [Strigomonas culicis]|eukprot:EPY16420.1 hypothetical protein STCU_11287 [Strigomonas culicis]
MMLPSRLHHAPSSASGGDAGTAATATTDKDGLIEGAVTGAYLRQLLKNTLVRVTIPPAERIDLLQSNDYVTYHNRQNNATTTTTNKEQEKEGPPTLIDSRVGRLVALLQKQKTHIIEHKGSAAPAPQAVESAWHSDWYVAVDVGERVHVFEIAALSDEPFSEVEHRIYVSSALDSAEPRAAPAPTAGPSRPPPMLLSSEEAAAVTQLLALLRACCAAAEDRGHPQDVHRAVAQLLRCTLQPAAGGAAPARPADGKREREADAEAAPAKRHREEPARGALQGRCERLEARERQQAAALQQLRELLQKKEEEVKAMVLLQRREAQQQAEATERLTASLHDERQRTAQLQQTVKERESKNEVWATNWEKLKTIFKKYKEVVDTVGGMLELQSDTGDGNSRVSVDEVMRVLQTKKRIE